MFTAYLDKNVYLMRDCDISAQMETLLCRIEQFESDYEQLADETAKAVLEILQKLHRQGRSQTRTLPSEIKEWIDLHVEENVKLEQLCESLHYSRNHLINQFRGRYGITPYQYLREQKIEAAESGTFYIPECRCRKFRNASPIRMKIIFTAVLKRQRG